MPTALTVTATQGGTTANGLALRVVVLTGASPNQFGGTDNNHFGAGTTSFTRSITTTVTGSAVYGACSRGQQAEASTAAALTTVLDDIADSANGERYVTFKATSPTGTPGATTLGYTITPSGTTGAFAQAEIVPDTTLSEDPSAPATASTTAATTVATATFTPPDGACLVALVASDGGSGVTTMTVSGGGLTWTEQVKSNVSTGDYAGVWIARTGPADPNDPVITAQGTGNTNGGMAMKVMVLTGARKAALQTGGTGSQSGAAAHQASVTTTVTGSWVYGAADNFSNTAPTINAQSTQISDSADATHTEHYVTGRTTAATGTPGAVTVGWSAPANGGGGAFAEILPDTTIAEDGSAPPVVATTSATFVSCADFTPPAGALLVALIASNGGSGTTTMAVSGGGLAWTELVKSNGVNFNYAGVWIADVGALGGGVAYPGLPSYHPGLPAMPGGIPFQPWPPVTAAPAVQAAPPAAPPSVPPPARVRLYRARPRPLAAPRPVPPPSGAPLPQEQRPGPRPVRARRPQQPVPPQVTAAPPPAVPVAAQPRRWPRAARAVLRPVPTPPKPAAGGPSGQEQRMQPRPARQRSAQQVPPSAEVFQPLPAYQQRPRRMSWHRRARVPQSLPAGGVTQPLPALPQLRPRRLPWPKRLRISQPVPPAMPPAISQPRRARPWWPSRKLPLQPAPPQVVVTPATPAPGVLRARRLSWPRRTPPGQVVPSAGFTPAAAAPAKPPATRARLRLAFTRRPPAQAVPPQVTIAPPVTAPQGARPRLLRAVLPRRRPVPAPQAPQPPVPFRARPRISLPVRRRPTPSPQALRPAAQPQPPRRLPLARRPSRPAAKAPPQVVIPPAIPAPTGPRQRRFTGFLRRVLRPWLAPPSQLPPPGKLTGLTAGPPHGRWDAPAPHGHDYDAGGPHGRYSALRGHVLYTGGSPHGERSAPGPHN